MTVADIAASIESRRVLKIWACPDCAAVQTTEKPHKDVTCAACREAGNGQKMDLKAVILSVDELFELGNKIETHVLGESC